MSDVEDTEYEDPGSVVAGFFHKARDRGALLLPTCGSPSHFRDRALAGADGGPQWVGVD